MRYIGVKLGARIVLVDSTGEAKKIKGLMPVPRDTDIVPLVMRTFPGGATLEFVHRGWHYFKIKDSAYRVLEHVNQIEDGDVIDA